ncbi:hypothetical protein JZO70_07900 [Enterococcus sp. 669A]|uniref:DUF1524 domain-containing protein n=1 Tax=Candidatus Enterococcus moelleringii TaxID=2815325 RepID=A0ABS3L901_9ENTE|nr:hypothetical protein [Enterococcus sp. 669A]MBO1306080.1 hypothetical protein [Enterococcus sp. 669A]
MTSKKLPLLKQKQLLNLSKPSMDKRFLQYFEATADAVYIIQAAVMVMVRNFFSIENLSFVAHDTIRDIFLNHTSELTSVRHLCIYFEDYFDKKEWQGILDSLFTDHNEYLQVTESARLHTEHIRPLLHVGRCEVDTPKNLALTFFDETGKKHRCTIKNVHRSYSTQENCDALSILSTLSIFEKDGVRHFTELAKSRFVTPEDDYDCANQEEPVKLWGINELLHQAEAAEDATEAKTETQPAPQKYAAHSNLKGKTKDELYDFLFEGVHINRLPDDEKISRTAMAMLEGTPVKNVRTRFAPEENPKEILDFLLKDWQKRLMTRETSQEEADTSEDLFRKEEIYRQRQEKQKQQKIDKALGKKGRKGKKGKNGKRKKR